MISTKQFTIFFLLVVIFLAAISITTSLAWREATGLYDTTSIRATIIRIIDVAAAKIQLQEDTMQMWVDEVDAELLLAEAEIDFFMATSNTVIHDATPAPPTP